MKRTFKQSVLCSFLQLQICLCLILASTASAKDCNKKQCGGPIRYLEQLKCQPIYRKPDNCCADRYDCSHLHGRSKDKCYVNGRTYRIGEKIKNKDQSNPCNIGCICTKSEGDIATFTCAVVECFLPIKEGCFLSTSLDKCCGKEVCPDDSQNYVKCEVEGQTYREGMNFYPKKNNKLVCQCLPGYRGENVEPFCREIQCDEELRHAREIHNNCAPVFSWDQNPRTDCAFEYRCQNKKDGLLNGGIRTFAPVPEDEKCKFGNLTMLIGDKLKQATDYSSVCVKCVCEVPPTPTCQRLPDNECDITVHPQF